MRIKEIQSRVISMLDKFSNCCLDHAETSECVFAMPTACRLRADRVRHLLVVFEFFTWPVHAYRGNVDFFHAHDAGHLQQLAYAIARLIYEEG
jgi:hypothetical protein